MQLFGNIIFDWEPEDMDYKLGLDQPNWPLAINSIYVGLSSPKHNIWQIKVNKNF